MDFLDATKVREHAIRMQEEEAALEEELSTLINQEVAVKGRIRTAQINVTEQDAAYKRNLRSLSGLLQGFVGFHTSFQEQCLAANAEKIAIANDASCCEVGVMQASEAAKAALLVCEEAEGIAKSYLQTHTSVTECIQQLGSHKANVLDKVPLKIAAESALESTTRAALTLQTAAFQARESWTEADCQLQLAVEEEGELALMLRQLEAAVSEERGVVLRRDERRIHEAELAASEVSQLKEQVREMEIRGCECNTHVGEVDAACTRITCDLPHLHSQITSLSAAVEGLTHANATRQTEHTALITALGAANSDVMDLETQLEQMLSGLVQPSVTTGTGTDVGDVVVEEDEIGFTLLFGCNYYGKKVAEAIDTARDATAALHTSLAKHQAELHSSTTETVACEAALVDTHDSVSVLTDKLMARFLDLHTLPIDIFEGVDEMVAQPLAIGCDLTTLLQDAAVDFSAFGQSLSPSSHALLVVLDEASSTTTAGSPSDGASEKQSIAAIAQAKFNACCVATVTQIIADCDFELSGMTAAASPTTPSALLSGASGDTSLLTSSALPATGVSDADTTVNQAWRGFEIVVSGLTSVQVNGTDSEAESANAANGTTDSTGCDTVPAAGGDVSAPDTYSRAAGVVTHSVNANTTLTGSKVMVYMPHLLFKPVTAAMVSESHLGALGALHTADFTLLPGVAVEAAVALTNTLAATLHTGVAAVNKVLVGDVLPAGAVTEGEGVGVGVNANAALLQVGSNFGEQLASLTVQRDELTAEEGQLLAAIALHTATSAQYMVGIEAELTSEYARWSRGRSDEYETAFKQLQAKKSELDQLRAAAAGSTATSLPPTTGSTSKAAAALPFPAMLRSKQVTSGGSSKVVAATAPPHHDAAHTRQQPQPYRAPTGTASREPTASGVTGAPTTTGVVHRTTTMQRMPPAGTLPTTATAAALAPTDAPSAGSGLSVPVRKPASKLSAVVSLRAPTTTSTAGLGKSAGLLALAGFEDDGMMFDAPTPPQPGGGKATHKRPSSKRK